MGVDYIAIEQSGKNAEIERKVIKSMKPYFPKEDIETIHQGFDEIISSGRLTLGKFTAEFESEFAKYVGVKHAVAANSGTCTLEMIYRALDVSGKEVITPTNTQIATSNAVIFAGGKPILADMDAKSLCINVDDAFSKVNKNTKAMVIVHIAGLIHPQMDEIRERCQEKDLILLEDAAHATGATRNGKKAGSLALAGSFSFYPAKVITAIEGGMITTDNDEIAESARQMRNHGTDSSGLNVRLGYNWRMSEVHSLIGLTQLRRIEEIIAKKSAVANTYSKVFADEEKISLIEVPNGTRHSYYKYPITLAKGLDVAKIQAELKNKYKVESGSIYFPPCHMQPVYVKMFGFKGSDLPIAEDVLKRTIALPIYAEMSEADAGYVAESLLAAIKSA